MAEDRDSKNSFNGQDGTQSQRLLATGKRIRVVDLETYSEERIGAGENLLKKDLDVQDMLRARFNKHWSPHDKKGNKGLPKVNSAVTSRTPIKTVIFDRNIEYHDVEDGEIFEPTTQEFKILPNKNLFRAGTKTKRLAYNKNMWWKFITDGPLPTPDAPPAPKGPLPSLGNISATPAGNNVFIGIVGGFNPDERKRQEDRLRAAVETAKQTSLREAASLQRAEAELTRQSAALHTQERQIRTAQAARQRTRSLRDPLALDRIERANRLENDNFARSTRNLAQTQATVEQTRARSRTAATEFLRANEELQTFLITPPPPPREVVRSSNFRAKLNWTFFNADSVEVYREDGERLTRIGGSTNKEAFNANAEANLKRKQLRKATVPRSRNSFVTNPFSVRAPRTRFESRLETRARLRREEFQRRQDRLRRVLSGELRPVSTRDFNLKLDFNTGTANTDISGFKTFRLVARNAVGVTMVRIRFRGRINGRNFIIAADAEGPRISTSRNPAPSPPPADTRFDNLVPTIDEEGVFFDHAFDINVPFSKKTLDKQNSPIGSLFADVQPTYNFFIDNYEQVIGSSSAQETLLPNMYAFLTELQNENSDEKNTIFRQHITLADTIPDIFVDITNQKGEKIGERDRGQYFDKYARAFGELMRLKPAEEAELVRKFTNLVTPISNIDLFKEFNEKRELFPMFFDISFSTDKTTRFAEVLEDSQLSNLLMKDILEGNISSNIKTFRVTEASQRQEERTEAELQRAADRLNQQIRRSRSFLGRRRPEVTTEALRRRLGAKITTEAIAEDRELEMWDVTAWMQQLSENPLAAFEQLDAGVFLGTYNNEVKMAESSQFDFFKNLLVVIFAGKVKKLVERELRTFEEVLNGKLAYSETAFYKIEKRDAATGQVLQNFFLPNSNDINVLRFIDTQVKYNKQYTYEIFAYQLVIGNKYSYEIREITEDDARIAVHNMPSIKLVKIPYYEFTGRIMDSPPIFPDVSILPFKSVNNRIKFHFNGNVGEYKLEPVLIEPGDAEIIKKLREAQMVSEEEFLRYAGDDRVSAFEIFRLNKKPRKFSDFTGKRIALVETDINSLTVQSATAAAFIDNIVPNRKYYYIFRTIDNHGHISNPTPIYELEIVDNDGIVFPVVKTVEFDMGESTKASTKTARKFIQIVPAFQQTLLNEEKSGLIVGGERVPTIEDRQNFHLGVAEEQVWQKNFKVRLTSRKTGKKLDLNVSFEHNNVRKQDNQGKILNEGTKN